MAFEEGEMQHQDAMNELELYKDMLEGLDPEEDKDMWEETNQLVRSVQMRIGDLEKSFDSVKKEYDTMIRESEKMAAEIADYEANSVLREQAEAAEQAMEEQKEHLV